MDLSIWTAHRAEWAPDKTALYCEDRETSYAALEQRVSRLAGVLVETLGVAEGDRVAHLGFNSPDLVALLFACSRVGAILVPLNWRLTAAEHAFMLGDCTPRVIFAEPDFIEHFERTPHGLPATTKVAMAEPGAASWQSMAALLESAPPHPPTRARVRALPLKIVYTSGTTGRPKGAVLTDEALFFNTLHALAVFDLTSRDRVPAHLPMFHVGGMNIMTVPTLHAGGTVVVYRRFDPGQLLRDIARHRLTLLLAVPAISQALITHPEFAGTDISSLRCVSTGSSTVPEAAVRPWLERGIPVTQVYGLTESAPIAAAVPIADAQRKIGSAGRAVMYCDYRIADDRGLACATGVRGEVWLRGPNLLREYWRNPQATAESFAGEWFKTGDIGHADADGFLYIDDRKKDVIISGGENIYPAELENVLADCAEIAEFAVIGRADAKWVEVPVAVIVTRPGCTLSRVDVLKLFDGRLARYKHPRDVVFVAGPLPRTSLGKVQKFELRARFAEQVSQATPA
jgi:fatty-acyl-CoA synthase